MMSLILLTYEATDAYVRLVSMHVIYLTLQTYFVPAVAAFLHLLELAHTNQVLEDDGVLAGRSHSAI